MPSVDSNIGQASSGGDMTGPFEKRDDIGSVKKLMGALLRQPPKLHEDMKLGKRPERKPKTDSEDGSPKGNARPSRKGR